MVWDPTEATFSITAERILARSSDNAGEHFRDGTEREMASLAARGLAQSGAALGPRRDLLLKRLKCSPDAPGRICLRWSRRHLAILRLLQKIDEGLQASRYGVVILSAAFFGKRCATWELNALAALEATRGRSVILPVWHELTAEQVAAQSPLLAAVYAISTTSGISVLADEIEKVLRG